MSASPDLARRAVACKGWRWMPGMRAKHRHCWPIRVLVRDDGEGSEEYVVRPGPDGNEIQRIDDYGVMGSFPSGNGSPYPVIPDLDDPATLGCLLALVREAWGDPWASVVWDRVTGWTVRDESCFAIATASTYAEALVAALEAAPEPQA